MSRIETRRQWESGLMGMDGDARATGDERQPRCLVVMYHYVHDVEPLPLPRAGMTPVPPGIHGLSTSEFRRQLDRLGRDFEPVDWPRFYAWTQGRGSIPEQCFLVTFDDGLSDHARHVAPILKEYGIRGTFFVPGAILISHRMLSAHALHILLSVLDERTIEQHIREYVAKSPLPPGDWFTDVDAEAAARVYGYEPPGRARLKYLLNMLLPTDLRNGAVASLFERYVGSMRRWAQHWYLSWDDLVEMQGQGHTIGGHGFCHEPLIKLTPSERRFDVRRVKCALDAGLGPDIRPFSYPFGGLDDDCAAACRKNGFVHAFTTETRWVHRSADLWTLPRVDTVQVERVLEKESVCHSMP